MLRTGRLDAIIQYRAPDADAAARLIELYAGPLLAPDVDLAYMGQVCEGLIPSSINEVCERAKLSALSMSDGKSVLLTEESIIYAAQSVSEQTAVSQRSDEPDYNQRVIDAARLVNAATH